MAEEIKCRICDRALKDAEALAMHIKAKHPEEIPKEKKSFPVKKIRNWIIFIAISGLVVFGVYEMVSLKDKPASEINIGSHTNIAFHEHAELKIIIDREEYSIPVDVGVFPDLMRPIHTHDSTGEIHIEGPYRGDFTIGEFFQIWNKNFSSECIFEYCTNSGTLKMQVNGKENFEFENYVMNDGDEMVIEYFSN